MTVWFSQCFEYVIVVMSHLSQYRDFGIIAAAAAAAIIAVVARLSVTDRTNIDEIARFRYCMLGPSAAVVFPQCFGNVMAAMSRFSQTRDFSSKC